MRFFDLWLDELNESKISFLVAQGFFVIAASP